MSTADKIAYTIGFLIPLAIIASMIAPSFMPLEQRLNWERGIDNITFGVLGIAMWIVLVIAPVVFCILAIVAMWMEPRP